MATNNLTHLSLFTGIGGIDLAAEWAGFETVGQVEKDEFCQKLLTQLWPNVPGWSDVRDVTEESFRNRTGLERPTLISGGFPCQPFSVAGKQEGKEDDRDLWPEMFAVIKSLRPTWLVGENVAHFASMGLDRTVSHLEGEGYRVRTFEIPAVAVGARHQLMRCFIVAYSAKGRCEKGERATYSVRNSKDVSNAASERRRKTRRHIFGRSKWFDGESGEWADPDATFSEWHDRPVEKARKHRGREQAGGFHRLPTPPYSQQHKRKRDGKNRRMGRESQSVQGWGEGWKETEPPVCRAADGLPDRVDRIKALGNAVVPQQIHPILRRIAEIEG